MFFTTFPIIYLAIFDKDVTYEHIMTQKEEQKYYSEHNFTGVTDENSFLPTKALRVLPLIKKNYHYLYYITQKGLCFGWHTFMWQVVNSLIMSLILCLVGYQVYSGDSVFHIDGHTADFWMASFGIFTALVFSTIIVVIIRAAQITWIFILGSIVCFSLGPFYFLSYLFDTILVKTPSLREFVMVNLSVTYNFYLFFILFMMVALFIEICAIYFRILYRPTLADYFMALIKRGDANNPDYFAPEILQKIINLQDPIQKKEAVRWSDAQSSKTKKDEEIEKYEKIDSAQSSVRMKDEHEDSNKQPVTRDEARHSVTTGDHSTNLFTANITHHNRHSNRSMDSQFSSMQASTPISPGKVKQLFVIDDSMGENQEGENSPQKIDEFTPVDKKQESMHELLEILKADNDEQFDADFSQIKDNDDSSIKGKNDI